MKTLPLLVAMTLGLTAVTAQAAEHTVAMKNTGAEGMMVFEPAVLNVAVGDTVKFVPTDMAHNSQSVDNLKPAGSASWVGAINEPVTVTIDLSAQYQATEALGFSVNAENVTDKKYLNSLYWTQAYYGAPRNISAGVRWDF